jgi:hypothetical protein
VLKQNKDLAWVQEHFFFNLGRRGMAWELASFSYGLRKLFPQLPSNMCWGLAQAAPLCEPGMGVHGVS